MSTEINREAAKPTNTKTQPQTDMAITQVSEAGAPASESSQVEVIKLLRIMINNQERQTGHLSSILQTQDRQIRYFSVIKWGVIALLLAVFVIPSLKGCAETFH